MEVEVATSRLALILLVAEQMGERVVHGAAMLLVAEAEVASITLAAITGLGVMATTMLLAAEMAVVEGQET